jgi:aminoglycoside/choline kinase family phosphotransferase/CTP:molybdopterin cytidylyltransferase MocA
VGGPVLTRADIINGFLRDRGLSQERAILAEDASFRRYWRLAQGGVLMDAPPGAEELGPFLRLQAHLAACGLSVPQVYQADPALGLVLLEDFGDGLFPVVMRPETIDELYDSAVDALVHLHKSGLPSELPGWGPLPMAVAAGATFLEWWWPAQFAVPPNDEVRDAFAAAMDAMLAPLGDTMGLVHRDYFAGNLFWLPQRHGKRRIGIIDFQDAALGHPAYDLVSLVEDARRVLPAGLAERQVARYLAKRPELDPVAFRTAYDACAAQRHLRVAGLWVRLAQRDGKPQYLQYGALTWALLERALRRPGAQPLADFMQRWVSPELRNNPVALGRVGNCGLPSQMAVRTQLTTRPSVTPPKTAMLLAAGLGTRMRPLTDRNAKPLLPLGGQSLLDHALDRLVAAGVERVVVNAHWQAELLERHLGRRDQGPMIKLLREEALLDTGGAVHAALSARQLGPDPFYVVNGDAFWLDGPHSTLLRLVEAFDPAEVDAVLLVHRTCQVHADVGYGDFAVDKWGGVRRRREREVVPYIYAGVQLVSPTLFASAPAGAFSTNLQWDKAIAAGRLRAVVHDGLWFHLSTPADLAEAEFQLQAKATGETR